MQGLAFIFDLAIVALVAGIAGLLCRKVGLSAVVGYLLAGILIGPYTPPFQLVQDGDRIKMLADLGLIFLVFGIGLEFSVRRMKRLGLGMLLATAMGALLVLAAVRVGSGLFGFPGNQSLFIAAVLMVSSSAIISKVLEEIGANHTRWGQLALGVTLLEDIVAVVMLTLLSSVSPSGEEAGGSLWQTITSFTGFVALLFFVILLLVPRMLRHLKASATTELLMLMVAGVLLLLGWIAARLDYSMALSAFILGAIIGSTPHRPDIDRLFEGLRHLFGAVFFVAMGMMFDVSRIGEYWLGVLGLAGAAFLLRIPATALALAISGNGAKDSIRSSLTLTPLGEFSFVIAFLGVQTGAMPESFYPAAVGASLLTCVLSPALIKRAELVSEGVERLLPASVVRVISVYHDWVEQVQQASGRNETWRRLSPVLTRLVILLLVIVGCVALARPAYRVAVEWYGPNFLLPSGTAVLFVLATGLVVLAPALAAWRSISMLAALLAGSAARSGARRNLQPVIERGFLVMLGLLAGLLLLVVVPVEAIPMPILAGVAVLLALLAAILWQSFSRLQQRVEARVFEELDDAARETIEAQWNIKPAVEDADWELNVKEVQVPSNALHAGQPLMDLRLRNLFNCSVVGIDRQGYAISNPSGAERVYPGDRLLVLGTDEDLARAGAFLQASAERPDWMDLFDDLATESVTVPADGPCHGRTLQELDLVNRFRVQVGGIRRGGAEILTPKADERLQAGDSLLLLGTHSSILQFKEALAHPATGEP